MLIHPHRTRDPISRRIARQNLVATHIPHPATAARHLPECGEAPSVIYIGREGYRYVLLRIQLRLRLKHKVVEVRLQSLIRVVNQRLPRQLDAKDSNPKMSSNPTNNRSSFPMFGFELSSPRALFTRGAILSNNQRTKL